MMKESILKNELQTSQLVKNGTEVTIPVCEEIGIHTTLHIVSGVFPGQNYVNIKYNLIVQGEWRVESGSLGGITHCACSSSNTDELFFNYTANFELATTSLFKFPCVLFTVYGMDFFGRSVIIGYGQSPISTQKGISKKRVVIFKPKSHTWLSEVIGKLKGTPTEFINAKETVINNEGRPFVRSETIGHLTIEFEAKRIKWAENGFQ